MSKPEISVPLGRVHPKLQFGSVLRILAREIYDNPYAFLRENLQNAFDAQRIRSFREKRDHVHYRIEIHATQNTSLLKMTISDHGIGMTQQDLEQFFWAVGRSSKCTERGVPTPESLAAGVVGVFGIGAYANFGVCDSLVVDTKAEGWAPTKHRVTRSELEQYTPGGQAPIEIHSSTRQETGTTIIAEIRCDGKFHLDELKQRTTDFSAFTRFPVAFNGILLEKQPFIPAKILEERSRKTMDVPVDVGDGRQVVVAAEIKELPNAAIAVLLRGSQGMISAEQSLGTVGQITGYVIFGKSVPGALPSPGVSIYRSGFLLAPVKLQIRGIRHYEGRVESLQFRPTAGRDSLENASEVFARRMLEALLIVVLRWIYEQPERSRRYADLAAAGGSLGMTGEADGLEVLVLQGQKRVKKTLGDIRRTTQKGIRVYYTDNDSHPLVSPFSNDVSVLLVVLSEGAIQEVQKNYLVEFLGAQELTGDIGLELSYRPLSSQESLFVFEVSAAIENQRWFPWRVDVIAGKITNNIPLSLFRPRQESERATLLLDVRHEKVAPLIQVKKEHPWALSQITLKLLIAYLGKDINEYCDRFDSTEVIRRAINSIYDTITRPELQELRAVVEERLGPEDVERNPITPTGKLLLLDVEGSLDAYLKVTESIWQSVRHLKEAICEAKVGSVVNSVFWGLYMRNGTPIGLYHVTTAHVLYTQEQFMYEIPILRPFLLYDTALYLRIPKEIEQHFIPKNESSVINLKLDYQPILLPTEI